MKKLTADDIIKLLAAPETDRIEFKESQSTLPQSLWESYSAFANTDGGIILLGVKEKDGRYHVQGVDDAEKLMQELWNSVNNRQKISANILFNRCVYAVDCNGKTVVVMDIPRPTCHDRLSLSEPIPIRVPIAAMAKATTVATKKLWTPCCATAVTKAVTTNSSKI
ncbi:MAG: ATP-binding protein [Lentisphaeria bacterium]|nr:ATP-binding protein [Lentisphaeria bacterium]